MKYQAIVKGVVIFFESNVVRVPRVEVYAIVKGHIALIRFGICFHGSGWTYWWLVWQLTGRPVIAITFNAASITLYYYRWMHCALDTDGIMNLQ
jgi:hypothetical protein